MSDVPAPEATEAPVEKHEETVSYDRFQLANRQAREAQESAKAKDKALKEMQDRLEELENQGKSETEQERAKRERAEKQLEDVQAQVQAQAARLERQERGSWVAAAAAAARFANPEDAVAFADLDGIENQKDAEKAVKKMADARPYLVRQETPGQQIGQVLADGRPVQPGQEPNADAEGEQFVADLKAALSGNKTSMPGLLDQ